MRWQITKIFEEEKRRQTLLLKLFVAQRNIGDNKKTKFHRQNRETFIQSPKQKLVNHYNVVSKFFPFFNSRMKELIIHRLRNNQMEANFSRSA